MKSITLLVVDDDPTFLQVISDLLHAHLTHIKIDTAMSATAALCLIERHDYDIIVTDIRMPQMDGLTLTGRISHSRPNTPILLVTAHGDRDLAVKSLNVGAYAYIEKPIDAEYFIATVNRMLHMRGLSRDVERQRQALQRRAEELEAAMQALQLEMTERQKAQAHLHETEERFRLLVEQVKDYAIVMIDTEGRVMTWNIGAELMIGYRADEIIGQPISRFYTEEDIRGGEPWKVLAIAGSMGQVTTEGWRVRKDGSRFWANVVITRLQDETGHLRGFAKVTRDLTDQKRLQMRLEERAMTLEAANEKLRELDQLKSAFVATVSHELRTPLTAIKGYANNLLAGVAGPLPEKVISYLGRVEHNADRLARMIGGLLDLARIEAGQVTLRFGSVTIADVVKEAIESLQTVAREKSIRIVSHHEGLPPIQADKDRVFQIVANLIQNALKFTPPHGEVVITSSPTEEGGVQVGVRDTGPGIPSDKLTKVFEKFYRLPSHGSEGGGAGLGLAISKSLVELHGGTIWAESTLGAGSAFIFTLPATPPAVQKPEEERCR